MVFIFSSTDTPGGGGGGTTSVVLACGGGGGSLANTLKIQNTNKIRVIKNL
ncbi:hypothetical protein [Flavobacterium sp. RSP15]|uniref:hypothetical protein n=1 Tax=Flavobacterium sp. RSP15 TaxID=2497485 RepID=UPI001315ADDC|nr:hypothetical protein [Flavobacterium sp. RSP15]